MHHFLGETGDNHIGCGIKLSLLLAVNDHLLAINDIVVLLLETSGGLIWVVEVQVTKAF